MASTRAGGPTVVAYGVVSCTGARRRCCGAGEPVGARKGHSKIFRSKVGLGENNFMDLSASWSSACYRMGLLDYTEG